MLTGNETIEYGPTMMLIGLMTRIMKHHAKTLHEVVESLKRGDIKPSIDQLDWSAESFERLVEKAEFHFKEFKKEIRKQKKVSLARKRA